MSSLWGYRRLSCTLLVLGGVATESVAAVGLTPAGTWDAARAAHLLRRAAFGGTPREVEALVSLGVEQAVDLLVDYERIPQTDPAFAPVRGPDRRAMRRHVADLTSDERKEINDLLRQLDRLQIDELRGWWLRRMIRTPRPLEERMVLFWHGHFTSGHREVRNSTMMYTQNAFFRAHALGSFRDLLIGVSQDPAMLRYLDNASNRRKAPNENYARELLELFTMGEGNYTEADIRNAARALTGWTLRNEAFAEVARMHDPGAKTFLGRTGHFDGYAIIDIILEHPATARHVARKILEYYLSNEPPPALVESLAATIRTTNYDMRETLRALFRSEEFYAPEAMHDRVKSPVDLVVGTMRLLELEPLDLSGLTRSMRGMGQVLFQPPNVKGWDGGTTWINTATLFTRYNFASALLRGTGGRGNPGGMMRRKRPREMPSARETIQRHLEHYPGLSVPDAQATSSAQPAFDPATIIEDYRLFAEDKVLNHFLARLLQMRVDPPQRKQLRRLLTDGQRRLDPRSAAGRQRVISLVNALLTMPEYQLN